MKNDELILTALLSGAMTQTLKQETADIAQAAQQIEVPYQNLVSHLTKSTHTTEITEHLSEPQALLAVYQYKPADWWASVRTELIAVGDQDQTIVLVAKTIMRRVPDIVRTLIRLPGGTQTPPDDDD